MSIHYQKLLTIQKWIIFSSLHSFTTFIPHFEDTQSFIIRVYDEYNIYIHTHITRKNYLPTVAPPVTKRIATDTQRATCLKQVSNPMGLIQTLHRITTGLVQSNCACAIIELYLVQQTTTDESYGKLMLIRIILPSIDRSVLEVVKAPIWWYLREICS